MTKVLYGEKCAVLNEFVLLYVKNMIINNISTLCIGIIFVNTEFMNLNQKYITAYVSKLYYVFKEKFLI